ncbi:MAG: polyprenyl synthetase family protein [Rikenellaceae bacterium]
MYNTEELLKITEDAIGSLPLGSEPQRLYEPIRYTMQAGGKRVRPLMLLLAANIFSDEIKPFMPAAIGVEIFHNFTLLHDDIMDNSPTRRGRDTVHRKWNNNVAILSGDAMLIYAYKLILQTQSQHLFRAMTSFNKLSLELCEGQQYDMDFEQREIVTIDEYLNMIRLKTSVLIAGAMEMGAILGGASEEDSRRVYEFGLNIGAAFQIQDDILDLYATSDSFGKPIGGDIKEGKKSYIFLLCYKMASDADRKVLLDILHDRALSDDHKISTIRAIYDRYHVKEAATLDAENYFNRGIACLEMIGVDDVRKVEMIRYSQSLIRRIK